jgi:capsular polysaccharide biosynthesis protein
MRKHRRFILVLISIAFIVIFYVGVRELSLLQKKVETTETDNTIVLMLKKEEQINDEYIPTEPYQQDHVQKCNLVYGWPFVKSWHDNKKYYCTSSKDSKDKGTTMFCREIDYDALYVNEEIQKLTSCELRNIMIDFSRMLFEEGKYNYLDGAFGGYCTKQNIPMLNLRSLLPLTKDIIVNLQTYITPPFERCTKWLDEPIIFMQRSETGNMYHVLTDLFNMWLVPQVMGIKEYKLVIFDKKPSPPSFEKVWTKLFNNDRPIMRAHEFGQGKICFKKAIFIENGFSSIMNLPVHTANCKSSALYRSFVNFMLNKLDISQEAEKNVKPHLVLISRRDRIGQIVNRQFQNEKEMIQALRNGTNKLDITVVDLADLTIEEQIRLMRRTDILFGQHGAGLANLLFLPSHAVVVEFNAVGAHYRNWASLTDHAYISFGAERAYHRHTIPVNIDEMMQIMDVALRMVRTILDRNQECGLKCPTR